MASAEIVLLKEFRERVIVEAVRLIAGLLVARDYATVEDEAAGEKVFRLGTSAGMLVVAEGLQEAAENGALEPEHRDIFSRLAIKLVEARTSRITERIRLMNWDAQEAAERIGDVHGEELSELEERAELAEEERDQCHELLRDVQCELRADKQPSLYKRGLLRRIEVRLLPPVGVVKRGAL